MFTKGIADRDFQVGPDGSLLQQGWTKSADPTRPGMVRSGAYEPLSNYNKTQATPSVMRRVMGAGAREHYALAKEKEDERLAAANQVGYSQEVSQSDTPGVFRSSAFARLQKKDPAKATMLYRQQMGQASNVLGADPNTPLNLFDRSY